MCISNKNIQLRLFYQNVQGLNTKLKDFKLSVSVSNYDVINLTETWTNVSIFDRELFDDRYSVYRKDRDFRGCGKGIGGGVLIAVKKQYSSNLLPSFEISVHIEELLMKIKICSYELYLLADSLPDRSKI